MFQKIIYFIKYNNFFTIGVMVIFLGAGMSFASSPALRDSVYASNDNITSVDNTKIINTDLDSFNFALKINSITEDTEFYYVSYSYKTLAIVEGVWTDNVKSKILKVNKLSLAGKDLGLYVARELGDNVNYELSYLKDVQKIQKGLGLSKKVITTEYAGLIGKILDPKEKIIEGYNPIIKEEVLLATPIPVLTPPDPALFVENTPGYVKPDPNQNIKEDKGLSEEDIKRIVEQMLKDNQQIKLEENPPASTEEVKTEIVPETIPETIPETVPETTPAPNTNTNPDPVIENPPASTEEVKTEIVPETIPETIPETVPETTPAPNTNTNPDPVIENPPVSEPVVSAD
jgi:hypothetical protein